MLQQILFEPAACWRPTPVSQLPKWDSAKRVSIDTETCDPQLRTLGPGVRRDGYMVGVSFAIEDGPAYYLPFGHSHGENLNRSTVFAYLQDQAKQFTGTVVGANLAYDLDYLAHQGISFNGADWFRDIQIADPLINELHFKYNLDAIAERWGCELKDETILREAAEAFRIHPKQELWKLDPKYVGAYAEADARNPLKILRRQEQAIDEADLWKVYNLESKVLPVLVRMRRRGVRIDFERLARIKQWCLSEVRDELAKVKQHTGHSLTHDDLDAATALRPVIESCGIKVGITAKNGQPNVDKKLFEAHIKHPVMAALFRCRKINKLRTTFCKSIEKYATNGRIHCTFNQVKKSKEQDEDGDDTSGAAYGRLSSEHPNLQQQPARDEFAREWRSIYLPDEGKEWCSCDFSQQEPRILTHYAAVCGCPGGEAAAERYRDDPKTDAYTLITEITGLGERFGLKTGRSYAKTISLGLAYGMGSAKLATSLGLPTAVKTLQDGRKITVAGPEAQSILDQFNNNAPYIRSLAKMTETKAKNTGAIKTIGGRQCHFPKDELGNYDWCNKALNRLIQGSAADQTKQAMVNADAAGLPLSLQVHDELCMSGTRKDGVQLAEIMRNAIKLGVPMLVDLEVGRSWGEAE